MTLRLINGDCIEQMKLLADKSVDLFVCDLPYGQLAGNGAEYGFTVGCAWDIKIDLSAFWQQVERLAKNDHTPVIHFCNTKFGIDLINSKPSWFRYDLVWNKERGVSFLSANKMPMKSHEMIYIFSKKAAFYNSIRRENGLCPLSVISMPKNHKRGTHSCAKPLELYMWLIERYSNPEDTVLDPTAGSFNSLSAALLLSRNGIGIEKDPAFYESAVARLQPAVNKIIPPE